MDCRSSLDTMMMMMEGRGDVFLHEVVANENKLSLLVDFIWIAQAKLLTKKKYIYIYSNNVPPPLSTTF